MDDFIKRSDALKIIETANSMASGLLEAMMKLCVTMDRIAAADVVPVVRCGECANKFDWPWCGMFPDDGYCSAGVKKDGDGE